MFVALTAGGCGKPMVSIPVQTLSAGPASTVAMINSVDPAELEWSRQDGTNTVTGFAVMRTIGGQPRTCAGEEVYLTPDSTYSRERSLAIYGSIVKGMRWVEEPTIRFSNRDINFQSFRRTTRCDSRGDFSFENIPDGVWYVATSVTWWDGYQRNGGVMMRRVELRGKRTIKVALPP